MVDTLFRDQQVELLEQAAQINLIKDSQMKKDEEYKIVKATDDPAKRVFVADAELAFVDLKLSELFDLDPHLRPAIV